MTDQNVPLPPSESSIIRFWQRIPLVIRAVLVGFLVFAITGSIIWTLVLILVPAPWSMIVMAAILWLYLKYFSGSWWPLRTADSRVRNFRQTQLPPAVWMWSLIAALLAVLVFEAGFVVTFRIIPFPAEAFTLGVDFGSAPPWLTWLYILIAALVAGITEEVGFRGYMQVPLETRYKPGVSITIVSIVFVLTHLTQTWAPSVFPTLFVISILWGILAYTSNSLIPVMISHTVTDIFNFSYWWTDVAGSFDRQPISQTGIDLHFLIWVLILGAALVLFTWVARKALAVRSSSLPN